uniref:Uncharacterized protein n=1 Tax=Chromera velia CCMP2878 TaxID=1169474 RepID=A0A0G4IG13_9ALVE|eukprot:Cvel_14086.t1-p1 / transcript=Cvel_14086.t1 / gene=Cvel_14086 / organism=Chromera_velia_CCMP2878 / gene_product=hypothetical protein / transcript_product=hypothetical protein / location=Cvel_scaffold989:35137-47357(+) / protein_length=104 / sequence_SO=supercontig / SO=protein_coding / is_pseudo=false
MKECDGGWSDESVSVAAGGAENLSESHWQAAKQGTTDGNPIEKHGVLHNDKREASEFCIIRNGVFRAYRSKRGGLRDIVYLVNSGSAQIDRNGLIEVRSDFTVQ